MFTIVSGDTRGEILNYSEDVLWKEGMPAPAFRLALEGLPTGDMMEAVMSGCFQIESQGEILCEKNGFTEIARVELVLGLPQRDEGAAIIRLRTAFEAVIEDVAALSMPELFEEWAPDREYMEGRIVAGEAGKLYRVQQQHTSRSHQPPGGEGMLAVYTLLQTQQEDGEVLPWVLGEVIVFGDVREHNGVKYECYNPAGAGANVHSPNLVPATWREVR